MGKFVKIIFLFGALGVTIVFINRNLPRFVNFLQRKSYELNRVNFQLPSSQPTNNPTLTPLENKEVKVKEEPSPFLPPPSDSPLPSEINLEAPFASQAPMRKWDAFHEELCEEAAILIVAGAKEKIDWNSKKELEEKLLEIVEFEKKLFSGRWKSTNIKEVAEVLEKKFEIKTGILENFSTLDLKQELAKKHFIIVPTYGRALGNPFYTRPGPIYHMLVIKGYKDNYFITHDPGTNQKGENYIYEENKLFSAIHDWPGKKEEIKKGAKRVLVVY